MATVRVDTSELVKLRERFAKMREQLPFATAQALTQTAQAGQAAVRQEMTRVFDRPTPYILDSTFIKPATKTNLEAHVYLKDIAGKAIAPAKAIGHEVTGGGRAWKRSEGALRNAGLMGANENAVPGQAAKLDAYGNISRGQMQQIMSALRANFDPYQNRSSSRRSQRNASRAGNIFYSSGRPGTGQTKVPRRGVWARDVRGRLKLLLVIIKTPKYKQRIDLQSISDSVSAQHWDDAVAAAWDKAIK